MNVRAYVRIIEQSHSCSSSATADGCNDDADDFDDELFPIYLHSSGDGGVNRFEFRGHSPSSAKVQIISETDKKRRGSGGVAERKRRGRIKFYILTKIWLKHNNKV